MIHQAWAGIIGNSGELRDLAALLDKVDDSIIADYVAKTGKDAETIKQMMADETWFSAQESLDFGFVNSVYDGKVADCSKWDLSAYANAPAALKNQDDDSEEMRKRFEKRLLTVESTGR